MRALRICALAALAAACNITETGNPELASFGVTARTSAPEQVALAEARRAAGPIVVEEAWVVLDAVKFVQGEVCDAPGETELDVGGPWVVDLVADPEAVTIELLAGDYCRVRIDLDRSDGDLPAGAPAELTDNVLVVSGTRADGAPFTIVSRDRQEADVRSRGAPFTIGQGSAALLLTFDVATWFEGVDLDAAGPGPDGHVRIADDSNEDVLDAFESRLEQALELYEDTDGDLAVEAGEEPIAAGG